MKRIALIITVLIAGRLFWLGYEAAKLGSWSLGLSMIAGALFICWKH